MATNLVGHDDAAPWLVWITDLGRLLSGAALVGLGIFLIIALLGFDPNDPSLNHATSNPVSNPMGLIGAIVGDLLLQLFGRAGWLPALAALALGARLLANRPLTWWWIPVTALPLALLATAAFFAGISVPLSSGWPFISGYGGFVGDYLFVQLHPVLSTPAYFWLFAIAALLLNATALGLRWGESLWAFGRMIAGSRWIGRIVGDGVRYARLFSSRLLAARAVPRPEATRRRPSAGEAVAETPASGSASRKRAMQADPYISLDDDLAGDPEDPPFETAASARPKRKVRGQAPLEQLSLGTFVMPGLELLGAPTSRAATAVTKGQLSETSRRLESVLDDFGVRGEIVDAKPGPVVTRFELEPAPGTRAARVIALADDIARSLCALSVRVAVVPGRNVIGIELPNDQRETVFLRDLLECPSYADSGARLALALGKDIAGNAITVDLARMPHLLIAGTTGSGKSVAINAMILSLLYRLTPEQCRIILIDPKVIELSVYEDIPHLLAPVVTEPQKAVQALKWVVRQMDERYRLMSHLNVRDIFAYNRRIEQALERDEQLVRRVRTGFDPGTGQPIIEEQPIEMRPLPLITVVVDEVADLMLTAGKEVEHCIQRLSQKARAAGVHLIVATQRPSVDVITGVIKANLPSRISFRVSSKIDSRTVLGEPGAEQLLGQGDMLHLMPGDRITRIHGPLVTDAEVEAVVRHLKAQGDPDYVEEVTREASDASVSGGEAPGEAAALDASGEAGLFEQAVQIVARDGKASTSYLQRRLSIGYNTAAKLIERMEQEGLISTADHVGRRRVLMGQGGVDGDEPSEAA